MKKVNILVLEVDFINSDVEIDVFLEMEQIIFGIYIKNKDCIKEDVKKRI